MKSYTDIEQSKELAKILPIESADMHYNNASIKGINYVDEYRAELMDYKTAQKVLSKYLVNPLFEIIPCWSLAALIQVLPITIVDTWTDYCLMLDIKAKMPRYVKYGDVYHPEFPWDFKKQYLLDSIVESIFWLHKNNYLNGSNR